MTDSTGKYDVSIDSDENVNTAHQPPTMMMASFRIDRDLYSKFGAIAKRERLTVTDVLTGYIQRCTDNDRTEYGVSTDTYNTDILVSIGTYDTDKFNAAVLVAVSGVIGELTAKLTTLDLEVSDIKKFEQIESV